ncbi:MAG: ABC transporter ATP-binding protein [Parachlamydiaceae bacterium]|nr:ABC transporter ATP-binding protein [Parachlamydiaceae bacterium]
MKKNLFSNLLQIISQYRLRLIIATIMIFISNGLLILNPLIFRQALIAVSPQEHPEHTIVNNFFSNFLGNYYSSAIAWTLILLAIAIISAAFKYYMRLIFFAIGREVEMNLREKLFARIQEQSKAFFDRHTVGDLLSRLSNDLTAYRDLLGPGMMFPMFFLSLVIPAIIALFYISPIMTVISIIPIFGVFVVSLWMNKPMLHVSQAVQKMLAEMSTMAHEHFSGIKLIKSYGIEKIMYRLFEGLCSTFNKLNIRFATLQGMFFPALSLIIKIATLAVVIVAGLVILLNWGHQISLADFLSFVWIQSYIFNPLLMFAWVMPMYQRAKASYARLVEVYEEPKEIVEAAHPLKHIPKNANIEFRYLNFSYPTQPRQILKNINLKIDGGSFVGITGPIGSGKTTIFRLLNREYEIPHGTILIGEHDIHQYSLSAFHQQIVTVEQLPFLFSKTIGENIKFGRQDAEMEDIENAARQADLHEDVLEFPLQYDTVVGERGVSLSGGQKQRMAIARAFLVNRSILLLDDIFSAVDAETAKTIFCSLKEKFIGKTVLIITHRVSVLDQMDRVIYMKEGQIVEDGKPEELVKKKGLFSALVDLQNIQEGKLHEN